MTTEFLLRSRHRFAQVLPWLIAGSAFAFYLFTLNPWLTLNSISLTAKVAGWDWQPSLIQPALFLATLPFRCLPPSWVPLALNASTALCAAVILALLARSVSVLPEAQSAEDDRRANDRHGLLSFPGWWLPPLLAASACALQLTFWEHAVSASGEMLDLLLFAYIIRCLFEYRLDQKEAWLNRAALICGVAMANNWAMVCFLPLLVIAGLLHVCKIIRVSPHQTPDFVISVPKRLLMRLGFLTLAGFSLFLLLPAVQALSPDPPLSFWQALRTQGAAYGTGIQFVFVQFLRYHREAAVVLALISLLPVLVMSARSRTLSIRDCANFGSGALILMVSYAGLLMVCLWVAFDPFFSPRQIASKLGIALPFLPLYYLAALSVGWYSGFFLLLLRGSSSPEPPASSGRFAPGATQRPDLQRVLRWIVPKCIYLLTALATAGLLFKNLPAIQAMNLPHLRQYGQLTAQSLPPGGGTVLSADPLPLLVLQATLAGEARSDHFVPVSTPLLRSAQYQKYLHRKFPQHWPDTAELIPTALASSTTNELEAPAEQVQLITRLAQTDRLFYLHPACGNLFEYFYLEPQGLIYELKRYPTNALNAPPLLPAALTNNKAFWTPANKTVVEPLQALIARFEHPQRNLRTTLMNSAHLEMPAPFQLEGVARLYAIALNAWGVTLQRNGRLSEATRCFESALNLNHRNLAAGMNLRCNSNLLASQKVTVAQPSALEEIAGRYRNVTQLVTEDGPVDDPSFCFQLGLVFAGNRLYRQSSQQFDRVKTLVSGDISAPLAPGSLSDLREARSKTLALLAEICADPRIRPLAPAAEKERTFLEAETWFDALRMAHRQLRINPDDTSALLDKGTILLRLGTYSNAIPSLTRVLALTNSPVALLNRAIAYLCMSNLAEAKTDYLKLRQVWPNDPRVYYGLGEIAYGTKDTNAAVDYYKSYLAHANAATEETKFVAARLKALQGSR